MAADLGEGLITPGESIDGGDKSGTATAVGGGQRQLDDELDDALEELEHRERVAQLRLKPKFMCTGCGTYVTQRGYWRHVQMAMGCRLHGLLRAQVGLDTCFCLVCVSAVQRICAHPRNAFVPGHIRAYMYSWWQSYS